MSYAHELVWIQLYFTPHGVAKLCLTIQHMLRWFKKGRKKGHISVTLFNHVGRFHAHGIFSLYYVLPMNKLGIFIFYSNIHDELEVWLELYPRPYARDLLSIPKIFTWNIVHPIIIIWDYWMIFGLVTCAKIKLHPSFFIVKSATHCALTRLIFVR